MAIDNDFDRASDKHTEAQRARDAFDRADAWAKAPAGTKYSAPEKETA
ncbi:MAG TPA: hypothetical protein VGN16_21015 [Acidobacteriaceae bacterium]